MKTKEVISNGVGTFVAHRYNDLVFRISFSMADDILTETEFTDLPPMSMAGFYAFCDAIAHFKEKLVP